MAICPNCKRKYYVRDRPKGQSSFCSSACALVSFGEALGQNNSSSRFMRGLIVAFLIVSFVVLIVGINLPKKDRSHYGHRIDVPRR